MRPASFLRVHGLALALLCVMGGCGSVVGFAADPAATSTAGGFTNPRDTVPNSDGSTFYFTATTANGEPGVYMVTSTGGAMAVQITAGPPLVAPNGLAISSDDQTLYISDTSAGLFKLAARGGTPQLLAGTDMHHPRGLDVTQSGGADVIFFTGDDPATGQGGVFTIAAAGGAITTVAKGTPLLTPVGIVVAKDGTVYVSNPLAFAANAPAGGLFQIVAGKPTQLVGGLRLGYPAGIALTLNNSLLLASGLDADKGTAVVYAVNLTSKVLTTYNQGISANTGAGGVHRARNADIFGWCGTAVGSAGTVYRIQL